MGPLPLSESRNGKERWAQRFSKHLSSPPNLCTKTERVPNVARNQSPSLATSVANPRNVHTRESSLCSRRNFSTSISVSGQFENILKSVPIPTFPRSLQLSRVFRFPTFLQVR